jgi:tetratricopeptide (TPR) repeat protein
VKLPSGKKRNGRLAEPEEAWQIQRALAETQKAAARSPEDRDVHARLGKLYLGHGDVDAAIEAFRTACRLAPGQWKTARSLSRALRAAGRHEEALEALEPLDGKMAAGPLGLERAALHRLLDRPEAALELLHRTLDVNPFYQPAWDDLIGLLEALGRTEEAEAARRRRAAVPRKYSAAEVVEAIRAAFPDETGTYVVNLGCRDGKRKDPCYELYRQGYPGLAIDAADIPALHANLPQPEVRKVLGTPLTPANVVEILRREGCPDRPVLLKIDIDSFDGPLLKAALADIDPDVVYIEINADFPPPLRFAIEYDPRYEPSGRAGFFGCSVAYAAAVGRAAGYELLQVDLSDPPHHQDATLVKERYLPVFGVEQPVDERELFLREPFRVGRGLVEIGVDTRPWRTQTDYDALLEEARAACVAASLARSGVELPFTLTL